MPKLPEKTVEILDATSLTLSKQMKTSNMSERSAALAVANAMILAGAETWGRNFSHQPMKITQQVAIEAIKHLSDHHKSIEASASDLRGRPPGDLFVSACRWELIATKLVIITAGASLRRSYASAASRGWKDISHSRQHASDGVRLLESYAREYGVTPIPTFKGKEVNRALLMSLATVLPPMFRAKKTTKS